MGLGTFMAVVAGDLVLRTPATSSIRTLQLGLRPPSHHSAPGLQAIVLAPAHPAKFAEIVGAAIGARNLPEKLPDTAAAFCQKRRQGRPRR